MIPQPVSTTPAFYTPREFAALFGRERRWAIRRLEDGTIQARKVGREFLIPADQVEAFLRAMER